MKIFAQGWSFHRDGPGCRRIYYLKGCNLACRWCASPESIPAGDGMLYYPERAEGDALGELCPHGAIQNRELDRAVCAKCPDFICRKWKHPAIEWCGKDVSPEDLTAEILRLGSEWSDFGGVTFGGGEPSLQAKELIPVLREVRKHGIHTAIESNAATKDFPLLIPEVDLLIADLKAGTAETFRTCTGGDFAVVLRNLALAAKEAKSLLIRIPFVPGCNDSAEERAAMAELLGRWNVRVEVLPFHHFGEPKYKALGLPYPIAGVAPPSPEAVRQFEKELNV